MLITCVSMCHIRPYALKAAGRIQPLVLQTGERAATEGKTLVNLLVPAALGFLPSSGAISYWEEILSIWWYFLHQGNSL